MADRRAFPQKKRVEIFTRQDGRCSICGEKLQPGMWHIDHIAALIHSGTNDDDNLRAICIGCHKDKPGATFRRDRGRIVWRSAGSNEKARQWLAHAIPAGRK